MGREGRGGKGWKEGKEENLLPPKEQTAFATYRRISSMHDDSRKETCDMNHVIVPSVDKLIRHYVIQTALILACFQPRHGIHNILNGDDTVSESRAHRLLAHRRCPRYACYPLYTAL